MINKNYKSIYAKYSNIFRFIFFLRYTFGVFLIVGISFLLIPHLFDYQKKQEIIKNYLYNSYDIKLNSHESIIYNSLPVPNIEIINASISLNSKKIKFDTKNLKIYPKLISIYNLENLKVKKIILKKNKVSLKTHELQYLGKYFYKLKKNIYVNDLQLKIFQEAKFLINIKKINFSNYGYNKNTIKGEVFNQKFKILIDNTSKKINFDLLKTGLNIVFQLNNINNNVLTGVVKSKVLNSNLKFNFEYDSKKIKIINAYFRNKNLSFKNESSLIHSPFFNINSIYNIENINIEIFKNINLNKILNSKEIIKKINSKNKIFYKPKKLNRSFIENISLKINLAYGKLIFSKNILIHDNQIICNGDANLLKDYPIFYFDCTINSNDKKKLLKQFSIGYKNKNELFNLNIKGNLNILSDNINFHTIKVNKNYKANKEDLVYFKNVFETILFRDGFVGIFNLDKIKEFILEIS
jgi:hypothetical protein